MNPAIQIPDPMLPLLSDAEPVSFARKTVAGRVFSQRKAAGEQALHSSHFYVEWPAESGTFHNVDVRKLVGILGDRLPTNTPFNAALTARILEKSQPGFPFAQLLGASKP